MERPNLLDLRDPVPRTHRCSREDIARRIAELARLMDDLDAPAPVDRMAGCPCRKENGGSGVCGCILGGTTITYSTASPASVATATANRLTFVLGKR